MSSGTEKKVGLIFICTYELCVVLWLAPARVWAMPATEFVVYTLACAHIDYVKS